MYDTNKMQEHLCAELEKKAESGIKSTAELDTVWKLIDSYKNLLKIDMLQQASEYSHDGDYSERRKRDSRGRYSSADHHYDGGSSYRSTRSPESKRDVDVSLRECMTKLKKELDEMEANADTREEREKIREMRREIGNLA